GFVGSHLAERLATEEGASVTATGRNLEAVSHLREAGVALHRAHMLDFSTLRQLVAGQHVVFHVAAWLGPRHGPPEDAWALNVYATGKLVRMAAEAGVRRLVLVSSIAAYGPPQSPLMDEDHPVSLSQRAVYGRTKAEGELHAQKAAAETGVELVIARPGIIYGPGSIGWSVRMAQFVQRGVPVIIGRGEGHAQPVFVENLVDGLLLAATAPDAAGRAFNFVDRPVPWRDWFSTYGRMVGRQPRALPLWLGRLALLVAERLPLGLSVDRDLIEYYTNRSVYPIQRAREYLDYAPRVDLEEGMAHTDDWLRKEHYL
ncbi:MAG TPA: NAD-dependent epimerase/dehydratase family protein, partial [Candidatus Binatia bacterium]|nr:NAD-dependent epimerase/dehydratase family protein [Candidatus Binatia bacterium]